MYSFSKPRQSWNSVSFLIQCRFLPRSVAHVAYSHSHSFPITSLLKISYLSIGNIRMIDYLSQHRDSDSEREAFNLDEVSSATDDGYYTGGGNTDVEMDEGHCNNPDQGKQIVVPLLFPSLDTLTS